MLSIDKLSSRPVSSNKLSLEPIRLRKFNFCLGLPSEAYKHIKPKFMRGKSVK